MVYYFDKNGEKKTFNYLEDMLEDMIGDYWEDWTEERMNRDLDPVKYGAVEYPAGEVLRKIDPVMFREYYLDYVWELVEDMAFTANSPEVNPEDGALIYIFNELDKTPIYILNEDMEDCE